MSNWLPLGHLPSWLILFLCTWILDIIFPCHWYLHREAIKYSHWRWSLEVVFKQIISYLSSKADLSGRDYLSFSQLNLCAEVGATVQEEILLSVKEDLVGSAGRHQHPRGARDFQLESSVQNWKLNQAMKFYCQAKAKPKSVHVFKDLAWWSMFKWNMFTFHHVVPRDQRQELFDTWFCAPFPLA